MPEPYQFPLSVPSDAIMVIDGNRMNLNFSRDTIVKKDETIGRRHLSPLLVTFNSRSQKIIMWYLEEPHYVIWNDFKLDNPWNELYFIGEIKSLGQQQFVAVPRRNWLPVKIIFFLGIFLGAPVIYYERRKKYK